jgi:hypothetical protein
LNRAEVLAKVLAELRAMRPSTDVNRLSLSRKHREDELGKLAYRRALNDACDRIAALAAQEGEPRPPADAQEGGGENSTPPGEPGGGAEAMACHTSDEWPGRQPSTPHRAQEGERGGAEVATAVEAVLREVRGDGKFVILILAAIENALADPAGALATHDAEVLRAFIKRAERQANKRRTLAGPAVDSVTLAELRALAGGDQ